MSKIAKIRARKILDSRGEWTIEVEIETDSGARGTAAVPMGESRGGHEAVALPADKAVSNVIEKIEPVLKACAVNDQEKIDQRLLELDSTNDKSALGANAMLGVSLACARVAAISDGMPLWQYLRKISGFKSPFGTPRLFALFTEGGLHAGGALPFQEYLVIPKAAVIQESVDVVRSLYSAYREYIIKQFGPAAARLGDEGAFAPGFTPLETASLTGFTDSAAPFAALQDVAQELGALEQVDFGLDAAASNVKMSVAELTAFYRRLRAEYHLVYFEDVYNEEDFQSFAALRAEFGDDVMVAGDDLTVTNKARMKRAHDSNSINSVIIKPNQIGTLTETLAAIRLAREYGWRVVVSHRGRETNDDFIADLAYSVGADGLKLGAPARGERVAKYNRLLAIEAESLS